MWNLLVPQKRFISLWVIDLTLQFQPFLRNDCFFHFHSYYFLFMRCCLQVFIKNKIKIKKNPTNQTKRLSAFFFDSLLQDTCHKHATKCTDEGRSPLEARIGNISLFSKWLGLTVERMLHDTTIHVLFMSETEQLSRNNNNNNNAAAAAERRRRCHRRKTNPFPLIT